MTSQVPNHCSRVCNRASGQPSVTLSFPGTTGNLSVKSWVKVRKKLGWVAAVWRGRMACELLSLTEPHLVALECQRLILTGKRLHSHLLLAVCVALEGRLKHAVPQFLHVYYEW